MVKKNVSISGKSKPKATPENVEETITETTAPVIHVSLVPPAKEAERDAWIAAMGDRLAASEVKTVLDEAADADQTRKKGPLATLWSLLNVLGVSTTWTPINQKWDNDSAINSWPVPGTAVSGVKKKDVTILDRSDNRTPEWHLVAKDNADGYEEVSYYKQMYERMETELMEQLRLIRAASDSKATINPDNPYADMTQVERDIQKRKITDKISAGTSRLRQAVSVWFKATELLAEFSDVIEIRLDLGTKKENGRNVQVNGKNVLEMKSSAIKIHDIERPDHARGFDAPSFLRLDVDVAVKNKGDYMAIISSGKASRGNKKRTPQEEINKFSVESMDKFAILGGHFMDTPDKVTKLEKKLNSDEDFRVTFGDFLLAAGRLYFDTRSLRYTKLGNSYLDSHRKKKEEEDVA